MSSIAMMALPLHGHVNPMLGLAAELVGRGHDAVAESFFASYKKKLIHTTPWPTLTTLRTATFRWIETYYNTRRRHSSLGYLTPKEYELGHRDIHELAA